jgi:hypothetical protein
MGYNGRRRKPPRSLADLAHAPKKTLADLVHGGPRKAEPTQANPVLSNEDIFQFITGLNGYVLGYCKEQGLDGRTVAGKWETLFNNVGLAAMEKADGRFPTHSGSYTVDDLKMDLSPYYLSDNWLYDHKAAQDAHPSLQETFQAEIAIRIATLRMRLAAKEHAQESHGVGAAR